MFDRVLQLLLPPGFWAAGATSNAAFRAAIAASFERLRDWLFEAIAESRPGSASYYIREWFDGLAIVYDSTVDLSTLQREARGVFTSLGGQNPNYLRQQIQIPYPDTDFRERTGDYPEEGLWYDLVGTIPFEDDIPKYATFVQKLFPLHLEPNNLVIVEAVAASDVAGVALCGIALCGRNVNDP